VAAFASTLSANELVKPLLGRARPDVVTWWTHADGYSLPSGHATGAIAFVLIGWLVSARITNGTSRVTVRLSSLLLAFGIGLSRPWLGVHWPSDIVAGWLWGGAFGVAAWLWTQQSSQGAGQKPS
jgi:undecaprenyl-diphosphatase